MITKRNCLLLINYSSPITQAIMKHSTALGGCPLTSFFIFFASPGSEKFCVKLILCETIINNTAIHNKSLIIMGWPNLLLCCVLYLHRKII